MESFLEFVGRYAGYMILMAVAGVIGEVLRRYINKKDLKSLPHPSERLRLIKQVRQMRQNGQSYQNCIKYLRSEGLRKGVAQGMMVDVESEQPPDLDDTRTLIWQKWTCEYPGNWKEQAADEGMSREIAVTLEGLGGSGISFYSHPDIVFEDIIDAQKQLLEQVGNTSFYNWGAFQGKGIRLKGIQVTYKLAMEVMVFEVAGAPSLIILQITMLEEEPGAGQAFDLIESSFQIHKIPTSS